MSVSRESGNAASLNQEGSPIKKILPGVCSDGNGLNSIISHHSGLIV
jgi:hypothetical protein